jgi:hypothetical protein
MEWLKLHWKNAALATGCLVGVVLLWAGFQQQRERPSVGVAMQAKADPQVAKETKTDTPVQSGTVKTYAPETKRKLDLPAAVQADATKQVVESSRVPADDHPQTVTTVIDTKTGATETFVARDPLPLLALDPAGEAGLYYGYRNGAKAIRIEARQGLFMVKAVHVGVTGSVDQVVGGGQTPPAGFVGVGAWTRW